VLGDKQLFPFSQPQPLLVVVHMGYWVPYQLQVAPVATVELAALLLAGLLLAGLDEAATELGTVVVPATP